MDPRTFCDVAELLVRLREPAALRSAVSRAYYSLFNLIHSHVKGSGVPLSRDARVHHDLHVCLFHSKNDGLLVVARTLVDLREARTRADYDMSAIGEEEEATATARVQSARAAIKKFEECLANRSQFDDAMKAAAKYSRETLKRRG
jgi:uncharacterized protein (UPF0332 family)